MIIICRDPPPAVVETKSGRQSRPVVSFRGVKPVASSSSDDDGEVSDDEFLAKKQKLQVLLHGIQCNASSDAQ